jgi:hypothetical protein
VRKGHKAQRGHKATSLGLKETVATKGRRRVHHKAIRWHPVRLERH